MKTYFNVESNSILEVLMMDVSIYSFFGLVLGVIVGVYCMIQIKRLIPQSNFLTNFMTSGIPFVFLLLGALIGSYIGVKSTLMDNPNAAVYELVLAIETEFGAIGYAFTAMFFNDHFYLQIDSTIFTAVASYLSVTMLALVINSYTTKSIVLFRNEPSIKEACV